MGSAGLGSRLHLVLNVSSHSRTSVSTEYFFLMAGDKGTSSKNSYSSIFSASACIKFINIPLTEASHMAQPKVSRVRIDILPTLLGGPVEWWNKRFRRNPITERGWKNRTTIYFATVGNNDNDNGDSDDDNKSKFSFPLVFDIKLYSSWDFNP